MFRRIYPVLGVLSSITHFMTVIIGGLLVPKYDHLYNTISELTASNAPKVPIIIILLVLYNLFMIFFGIGVFFDWDSPDRKNRMKMKIAATLFIGIGLMGLVMLYFAQDPRDMKITFNGKMHLVFAWIASLLTPASMVLAGMSFKNDAKFKDFRIYSYISFVFVLISGGLAGFTIPINSAFGGLFQRLSIGSFVLWVFVISLRFLFINREKNGE